MKCILSILLFSLIALAAPISQNFRLRILRTEGASGGPLSEYLGLKDGVAVITKNASEIITAYLDPDPNGMLYTDKKIPGYLFPTDGTGTQVYDFRFGGIPKDGEGWTLKFHASKPPSVEGSEGVDLIREAI
ncbi:hypothetical protein HOY82DRAFT_547378 [Tuber indicum]|nr:hypothetical protein HOY82DRAFT_547378 [Tuber indicum]